MPHVAHHDRSAEPAVAGAAGERVRWLLTETHGGARRGSVAEVTLQPGARQPLHRHANAEEAAIVLDGDAVVETVSGEELASAKTLILARRGVWHGIRAGESPVTVLTIFAGPSDPKALLTQGTDEMGDLPGDGGALEIVDITARPRASAHDPARGFFNMSAGWLVAQDGLPSSDLIVGAGSYGNGYQAGGHALHRHEHGEEWAYVLDGRAVHLAEDREIPLQARDFTFVPAREWHGIWNSGPAITHAVFGYLGVGQLEATGYELRDRQ